MSVEWVTGNIKLELNDILLLYMKNISSGDGVSALSILYAVFPNCEQIDKNYMSCGQNLKR